MWFYDEPLASAGQIAMPPGAVAFRATGTTSHCNPTFVCLACLHQLIHFIISNCSHLALAILFPTETLVSIDACELRTRSSSKDTPEV